MSSKQNKKKARMQAKKEALKRLRDLERWHDAQSRDAAKVANRGMTAKQQDVVTPPRNGPCPIHPTYKLKNCPHDCLTVFRSMRDREMGAVVQVVPVGDEDPRAGQMAFESMSLPAFPEM